ncbi:MAG: MBOAT family protein [Melioribacteraceae bacterium]|nr:MBOAT family protein [Melioribacteraceae bacterium]
MININFENLLDILKYKPNDPLVFSTSLFLFLFLIFLFVYNLFAKHKSIRLGFLILFSLYFYYKSAGYYAGIIVVSAIVNFLFAKGIASSEKMIHKRIYLFLAILINISILGYFKYTNFILQVFSEINKSNFEPLTIFLPIGISFYTFKSLSYVFDVYLETLEPTKSFRDFCVYVFFFPNILMGPIDRASKFLPQIEKEPFLSKEDLGTASFLIIAGLFKKVVIADYISLNFVDRIFDFPLRYTGVENLLAIYGYTLQVYCDFSGYTDMAIGVALFFGFRLMDNFNSPFKATSIADFWRRWHISLSTWLLDYIFKPLQFSMRSIKIWANIFAIFITFVVCGIWHGAGWNFIIWGALHGFMMSFALLIQKPKQKFYSLLKINNSKILKFFQTVITFHLIAFSFLIFRTNDFQIIEDMISQILNYFHAEVFIQFAEKLPIILGLIVIGYLLHFIPQKVETSVKKFVIFLPWYLQALLIVIVIWIVAQFKSADIAPFIYFQF